MLIISGEFDLSIGSTFAMVPLTFLVVMENGVPMGLALPLAILIGPIFGFINGLITTKVLVPSFIVTLGTMKIYRGLTLTISGGVPRTFLEENFVTKALGGGNLFGVVDMPAIWLIIFAVIGYIILHKTTFGFKTYATGGNLEAAKISGIKTDRIKIINFCLVGTAAGFAGLVSLFFTSTTSGTMGAGYELDAIAVSVVGGAMLTGGVGSILGTFLGAFILSEIRNGLILNMVNTFLQEASLGFVIILAVIINTWVGRTGRRKQ
jgi:ribose/xylose/arabinose/galactoside ABC-type transport system permease subunit